MSLGENSLVAAYQGKGQLKSRPSGTRVVTLFNLKFYCWAQQDLYHMIIHGRDSVVGSVPCIRKVTGSNPTLAAT